jgi:hypothetical protein
MRLETPALCGHRTGFGEDNEIQEAGLVESSALSARAWHPKDHPAWSTLFPGGDGGHARRAGRPRRKYGAAIIVEGASCWRAVRARE